MSTKRCCICKQPKSLQDFNKNCRTKDGLQNFCRECGKARSKRYYSENKAKHRKVTAARRKINRAAVTSRLNLIKATEGCRAIREDGEVCGEKYARALDFHNLDPTTKCFSLCKASSYEWPLSKVMEEVRKCVVLCATCHRKVEDGVLSVDASMLCSNWSSHQERSGVKCHHAATFSAWLK